MSRGVDPGMAVPELMNILKHSFRESEYDQVQNILMDREKEARISQKKCRQLETRVGEMEKEIEDLKRQNDELRREKIESDEKAESYKIRVEKLEPRIMKVEVEGDLADLLNVKVEDLAPLANSLDAEGGNVDNHSDKDSEGLGNTNAIETEVERCWRSDGKGWQCKKEPQSVNNSLPHLDNGDSSTKDDGADTAQTSPGSRSGESPRCVEPQPQVPDDLDDFDDLQEEDGLGQGGPDAPTTSSFGEKRTRGIVTMNKVKRARTKGKKLEPPPPLFIRRAAAAVHPLYRRSSLFPPSPVATAPPLTMSSGGNNEDPNRGQEEMNRGKKAAGKRKPSMRPFVQPVVRPRAEESSQEGQSTGSQLQLASSSRSHPTLDTRLTIRPGGNSFIPGNEGGQKVTQVIRSRNYSPGAGSWSLVPDQVKQHYWREFQKLCVWEPEFDGQMYKLFDQKAKHRYNQLMNRLHGRYLAHETPPPRLGAISDTRDVWDTLVEYWNTEEFKKRSKRVSENRRSNPNNTGIAKHRAGSRSIYEHQLNFKETTGEEPDFFDTMQFGHPYNPLTGQSTYFRTTEIHQKMQEAIAQSQLQQSQNMSEDGSCAENTTTQPPIDKNKMYVDVVGVSKGRIVGLGDYGREVRQKYKSPSSSSVDSHAYQYESDLQKKYDHLQAEQEKVIAEQKKQAAKTARNDARLAAMERWMTGMAERLSIDPPPNFGEPSGEKGGGSGTVGDTGEEEKEEDGDDDGFQDFDD